MAENGIGGFDFSKKIGGIPLGVWVAVVFGALAIGVFWRQRSQDDSDAEAPIVLPVGPGRIPGPDGASSGGDDAPSGDTDNEAWLRRAIAGLIALKWEPQLVDTALRRYLAGEPLTDAEKAVKDEALRRYGPPPESVPLPPPDDQPLPAPADVTTTQNGNKVIVSWATVADAEKYEYRVDGFAWGIIDGTSITYALPDSGLRANTQYTFRVHALNDRNRAGYNGTTTFTVKPWSTTPPPPPPPPSPSPPPSPPPPRTYIIQSGDTLSAISLRYYGTAFRWMEIYNANASTIEAAARAHGRTSSRGGSRNEVGWYIYPGTVLVIP